MNTGGKGQHFSESVTFEAKGLDDILKQVREAKAETEALLASQLRLAGQVRRPLGMPAGMAAAGRFGVAAVVSHVSERIAAARNQVAAQRAAAGFGPTYGAVSAVGGAPAFSRLPQSAPIPLASGPPPTSAYGVQSGTMSPVAERMRRIGEAAALARLGGHFTPGRTSAEFTSFSHRAGRAWNGDETTQVRREKERKQTEAAAQTRAKALEDETRARAKADQARRDQQQGTGVRHRLNQLVDGDNYHEARRERAQAKFERDRERREQANARREEQRHLGLRGRAARWWGGREQKNADGSTQQAGGFRDQARAGLGTAGNVGLGLGVGMVGMGIAGLSGTVTMNRFTNQVERVQHELGNALGPALREVTGYVKGFGDWLREMSPQQQKYLMYLSGAIASYAALKTVGMGGVVEQPARWAAGATIMGVAGAGKAGAAGATALGGAIGVGGGAAAAIVTAGAGAAYGTGRIYHNAQESMDNKERWARGMYTEDERSDFGRRAQPFAEIADPDKRRKALLGEETRLTREKEKMEGEYSTFGRTAGEFSVFGYRPFGSYGGRRDELDKNIAAVEGARKGAELDVKTKNTEVIAGGQFESFLGTYQRLEGAFGKIAGEGTGQNAGEELKEAGGIFMAAVRVMQEIAEKQQAEQKGGNPLHK